MALINSALTFDLPSWDETHSSSHFKQGTNVKGRFKDQKADNTETWMTALLRRSLGKKTALRVEAPKYSQISGVRLLNRCEGCGKRERWRELWRGETTWTHNMDTWICKFTTFQLVLMRDWVNREDQLWRNVADIKEMLYKMIKFVCLLCGNSSQCRSASSAYSNNIEHCWEAEAKQDKELTW